VRRNHAKARINLDLPEWMIQRIDRVAGRNGIARQAQIKTWLADKIKAEAV
jgi:predicted DNA binding CopG/RHH family protein